MNLLERIDELAARHAKPPRIQDVWDATHQSDYEPYRELQAKNWANLSVEDIRSFRADVAMLNREAWKAFLPALMRQSLVYPYLTYEYEGTLVIEVVALLSCEQTGHGRNLREAIRAYSKEEKDVVREWLQWFAEQSPNLSKRSEWEARVYRQGREDEVRHAIEAIED
ncbi:MAG: hypothetical protein KDE03_17615 [Rhodobacteraceae bacterium]|nr:hypothetical protein [Paracoccaceae bacterium]